MWAATPLQPVNPLPSTAISTTKPPPQRRITAVYSTQNRPESNLNLKSKHHQNAMKSKTKTKPAEEKEQGIMEEAQQRQLRGADVLMALQRAKSQKLKIKQDVRISKSRNDKNGGVSDFSDVRPLCIKPEWSDRLEELERRLQELMHS